VTKLHVEIRDTPQHCLASSSLSEIKINRDYITTHSQTPIFFIVSRVDKRYLYNAHQKTFYFLQLKNRIYLHHT